MPVSVVCPTCAAKIKTPDKAAGKRVKCPKCGKPLLVPSAIGPTPDWMQDEPPATTPRRPRVPNPAKVEVKDLAAAILSDQGEEDAASQEPSEQEQGVPFSCPSCKEAYRVSEELAGKKIRCRKCGASSAVAAGGGFSSVLRPAASPSLKVPELKDLPKPGFPWLPVVLIAAGVVVLLVAGAAFVVGSMLSRPAAPSTPPVAALPPRPTSPSAGSPEPTPPAQSPPVLNPPSVVQPPAAAPVVPPPPSPPDPVALFKPILVKLNNERTAVGVHSFQPAALSQKNLIPPVRIALGT